MTTPAQGRPATVDEYLERLPEDKRAALEDLRQKIRDAAPDAEETIAYQVPAFKQGRGLVSFSAAKNHCSFITQSPPLMASMADELGDYDVSGSTIRFTPDERLPADLVRRIVQARIAEIAGNG